MSKSDDTGIIKLDNGCYAYRFTIMVDGQKISQRKSIDAKGNKTRTIIIQ